MALKYPAGTQIRTPVSEEPDSGFREAPPPPEALRSGEDMVVRLRLLWTHRRFLLSIAVYALGASALFALLIPTRYESTTRLMPPDNESSSGLAAGLATAVAAMSGGSGGLGAIAGDFLGLKSTSEIFVGILSSRTAQDKLIQKFDLQRVYGTRRIEDARRTLADRTVIAVDRKSQIITITVTDHDKKRAQALGQAYVEELNRLVAELSTSSARRERMFLEQRLQEVSKDLESAEKEFSQFSSKNSAIDIKEQGRAMVAAAATLQGQLIAAESELEGLRQIYSDNNVRVRSVRARVEELQQQLEKIGGKGEDTSAPASQQQDSLYPSIRQLPLLGVPYADLYRKTRVQEAVFESLTKEYELAKVQEAKEIPVVKVLDSPDLPDKKSFPPRTLITLLGMVLALAGATTWIFGKAFWEQTDSADPRKMFAQEVLTALKARIPQFARNGSRREADAGSTWTLLGSPPEQEDDARQ